MTSARRRVTQQDIARELGLHRTTICLALKNYPNIPEATRERVRQAAERLGYVPDPMLSALAAYRTSQRPVAFNGSLAWLVNDLPPHDWRHFPIFTDYFKGAVGSAAAHGFNLEVFDLNAPGMSAERMAGILRARNISGILVCPQPRPGNELSFPWDDFSAVAFGYSLVKPALHCIAPTQYRATLQTMERVRLEGYRRIGLATTSISDQRVNHNFLAAYLAETFLHDGEPIVLPFKPDGYSPGELRRWVKKTRIEAAVVSLDIADLLAQAGLDIPGDLALACPSLFTSGRALAGVQENSEQVGAVAVNFLVSMIQRGERGIPATPQHLHVEGEWLPGVSLPPKKAERRLPKKKKAGGSRSSAATSR